MKKENIEKATKLTLTNIEDMRNSAIAVVNSVGKIMQVAKIQTIADASHLINTAFAINDEFSLAVCKAFQMVKDKELYKDSYDNFAKWAKDNHGVEKVTAYNYVKVGRLVTEDGLHSILPRANKEFDYNYSSLVIILEKLVRMDRKTGEINESDIEFVFSLCNESKIYPSMPRKELKKAIDMALKIRDGKLINEDNEEIGEIGENGEEIGEEMQEKETVQQVEKSVKISLTVEEIETLYKLVNKKAEKDENLKGLSEKLYMAYTKAVK